MDRVSQFEALINNEPGLSIDSAWKRDGKLWLRVLNMKRKIAFMVSLEALMSQDLWPIVRRLRVGVFTEGIVLASNGTEKLYGRWNQEVKDKLGRDIDRVFSTC